MNWIISKTKIEFYTNLYEVLKPIWENLSEYNNLFSSSESTNITL